MKAVVLGAGSWGTALSILLRRGGHEVTLFGRDSADIEAIVRDQANVRYLPGVRLPEGITATTDENLPEADIVVVAVPSHGVADVAKLIRGAQPTIVVASKGLEEATARTLSEVCRGVVPQAKIGVLSGPNLAVEVVRGVPTAAVVAFPDEDSTCLVRDIFLSPTFRIYASSDVLGVELAGALKNVLAIGAGVSDGLGYGDNTKGALLARGLHQMSALGVAMGAHQETFLGIAGVGDLFATAASKLSRNYRVGRLLGEGHTLAQSLEIVGQVAEGVPTARSAVLLAKRHHVDMPIFDGIERVLDGSIAPRDAVGWLMERVPKAEVSF